jgi:ATP-binding cassette subfamily C (CFTR/MRP) protein 1
MQNRIKPTSQMLTSFKAVKMLGADERIRILIQYLRNIEIKAAKPFRNLLVQKVILCTLSSFSSLSRSFPQYPNDNWVAYITLTLSPVLVFGTFIAVSKRDGSEFDISRLFTSLILISLLASPLIQLFQVIPSIGAAIGCLERIQTYLDIEEREDFRRVEDSTRQGPLNQSDHEKAGRDVEKAGNGEEDVVLSMTGASFSWTLTSRPVLKNVTLSVYRGQHVAIIGQVGSGKSLLLSAILGEALQTEGLTILSCPEVAYCSQTPWLENLSGMDIVSRYGDVDAAWIKSVVWACALEDVEGLKEWSEGSIGTTGVGLSGGQKQRLVS